MLMCIHTRHTHTHTHDHGLPVIYQLYQLNLPELIMLKQVSDVFFMISFKHLNTTAPALVLAFSIRLPPSLLLASSAAFVRFCSETVACFLC